MRKLRPVNVAQWPAWTALQACQKEHDAQIWGNSRYTVALRSQDGPLGILTHLSLHDHWRTVRHDWRDLQKIKNELLGPETEAFEIYPKESNLVDSANEYHLWALSSFSFNEIGVGWGGGARLVSEGNDPALPKTRQRPFAPHERPAQLLTGPELLAYAHKQAQGRQTLESLQDMAVALGNYLVAFKAEFPEQHARFTGSGPLPVNALLDRLRETVAQEILPLLPK